MDIAWDQANFLHNVHQSILDPEFKEEDVWFINTAFRTLVERLGSWIPQKTAGLMIEFHDLVPPGLREKVTWEPDQELKRRAAVT